MTVILGTIKVRGDSAANWASANPVLANRELGLDETAQRLKVGDGVTAWNSLPYLTSAAYTDEQAQDAVGSILTDSGTIDFTYDDAGNSITAILKDGSVSLAKLASGVLDTDGTLAANSDGKIASQKAVKTYVDASVTGVMKFKGVTDCSGNPNYPAASKGDAYIVTVAGRIGGASGKSVDVGDVYLAAANNVGGTEASVGASWNVLEHNLIGALLAANNLSDLASASSARTNLGLAIGTNVQAYSALLAAYAGAGWGAGVQIPALTAANTIALKTVGSASGNILDRAAGDALYVPRGSGAYTVASSFPGSPASGDRCWRTDRNIEYYYDGTRWLSTILHETQIGLSDALLPVSATRTSGWRSINPYTGQYDIYVVDAVISTYIVGASTWGLTIYKAKGAAARTSIATRSTSADTGNSWTGARVAVNAVVTSDYPEFEADAAFTSGGNLYPVFALTYRLVG